MNPVQRSLAGLAIAIVAVPVFMGLVACIPVGPMLGDPEESRVDPLFNGYWIDLDEQAIALFQPWDQRTWLIAYVGFHIDEDSCPLSPDRESDSSVLSLDELVALDESNNGKCFIADDNDSMLLKGWRSEIGGQWFWTWEYRGVLENGVVIEPVLWFSFRERRENDDKFVLQMIDFDHEKFEEHEEIELLDDLDPPFDRKVLEEASAVAEKVIRQNLDDDELYDPVDAVSLQRIDPEHVDVFSSLIRHVLGDL